MEFATPLIAVDCIEVLPQASGLFVRATKKITASDPYLAAHFPGFAIFPGVFVIESVRQAVIAALGEVEGVLPEIRRLHSVRFLSPMFPGDSMTLEASIVPGAEIGAWEVESCCKKDSGAVAARLKLEFYRWGERLA